MTTPELFESAKNKGETMRKGGLVLATGGTTLRPVTNGTAQLFLSVRPWRQGAHVPTWERGGQNRDPALAAYNYGPGESDVKGRLFSDVPRLPLRNNCRARAPTAQLCRKPGRERRARA